MLQLEEIDYFLKLTSAYQNECESPILLPHETEAFENTLELLENQVQALEATIQRQNCQNFVIYIYQTEIERYRYILQSYLQLRLSKIESLIFLLELDEEERAKMSVEEYKYYNSYLALMDEHLKGSVLDHLPSPLDTWKDSSLIMNKNLNNAIAGKITCDEVEKFVIDEKSFESIDLFKGDIYVASFNALFPLIKANKMIAI